jgi:hypothetical protein
MFRYIALSLWAGLCLAQTAPGNTAGPPPPGVDEALRARINQFYQLQVDAKYRQAESLVAEDTKDFYYAAGKPKYLSFEISQIIYSDNFTRAKAVTLCEEHILVLGFADKPIKAPIRSTWKLVDGEWFYYVDPDSLGQTPIGLKSPNAGVKGNGAPPGMPAGMPTAEQIQKMLEQVNTLVKVDKDAVDLKPGETAKVTIINASSGFMSVVIQTALDGLDVTPERLELKAQGNAVLTLRATATAKSGSLTLQVEQTNQVIPIQVKIPEAK